MSRGHLSGLGAWAGLVLAAISTGTGSQVVAKAAGAWWERWSGLGVFVAVAAFAWALCAENWRTIRTFSLARAGRVDVSGRIAAWDATSCYVPLKLSNLGPEPVSFEDGWTLRVFDDNDQPTAEYRGQLMGEQLRPLEHAEVFRVKALFFGMPGRPPIGTRFEVVGRDLWGNPVGDRGPRDRLPADT